MNSSWTPLITLIGAFGAAFLGQHLSHRYSLKRDYEKALKESLQKLYSPTVYKIKNYLDAEHIRAVNTLNPHLGEATELTVDVKHLKTNDQFNEIRSFIGANLVYAEQELIMQYELSHDDVEYNYGAFKSSIIGPIAVIQLRIEVCSALLSDYLEINRKLSTLSKRIRDELEGTYFFTLVMIILFHTSLHELAMDFGFRVKDLIESQILGNKEYLKRAEYIVKEFRKIQDNLEEFSADESNKLEEIADAFLYQLSADMKYIDVNETYSGIWANEIEHHKERRKEKDQQAFQAALKEFESR